MNINTDKYFKTNKNLWNQRVSIHEKTGFYDLQGFRNGRTSLNFIELDELGDVKNKSLLHLQCHFGLDTLSWARLGANVTGVDFSEEAVSLANSLSKELKIDARFVCCNIYDLKKNLNEKFDIVFTSYGVLGWLPDLNRWAEIAATYLKPGGIFCLIEFHPVVWMFDDSFKTVKYSYFNYDGVIETVAQGSYADRNNNSTHLEYGWNHSLSDIIEPLAKHGLMIESFKEYPFSVYNCFKNTIQGSDGWWRIKNLENKIPMMFSLKAIKR